MTPTRVAIMISCAVLALGLTACSSTEPQRTATASPPAATASSAPQLSALETCATGHVWTGDLNDLGAQLLAQLTAQAPSGATFTGVTAAGSQTLTWSGDGRATIDSAFSFTIAAKIKGLSLVLTQGHNGPAGGTLTLVGSTAKASGWDSTKYAVTNLVSVNGKSIGTSPIAIPSDANGVDMLVTCTDKTLTTHGIAAGSYATEKWTRP